MCYIKCVEMGSSSWIIWGEDINVITRVLLRERQEGQSWGRGDDKNRVYSRREREACVDGARVWKPKNVDSPWNWKRQRMDSSENLQKEHSQANILLLTQ